MSTTYTVHGQGRRLTLAELKSAGCTIELPLVGGTENDNWAIVQQPSGFYLHFYRTGKTAWNLFERFGGNDTTWMCTYLGERGYSVTTEHGEAIV